MENRPPGPEDAENSTSTKSKKAEHLAAWLRRQRDDERHILRAGAEQDDSEEEDDKKDTSGKKKAHHLRLGSLTVQGGDAKPEAHAKAESKSHEGDASHEGRDQDSAEQEAPESAAETPGEFDPATSEAAVEIPDLEDDFEQWERELTVQGPELGSADMQVGEEEDDTAEDQTHIPQQRTVSNVSARHSRRGSTRPATPTTTASNTTTHARYAAGSPPPVSAAGGGGNVPPMPPSSNIPGGPYNPNGPFGPNNPNAHHVFNTPNTLVPPAAPNVLTIIDPNKINDHEHKHGHPRLAFWVAAGIIVAHMIGKRADERIEKESRDRTDKLREQIKRNQTSQDQARQKMEAQQNQLATEQARQRQVLEYARPAVNNVERSTAPGRAERAAVPNSYVEATQNMVDAEFRQDVEQVTLRTAETEARSQSKVIMERIATAAEFDEPVERLYERRQEVKDEPSNPAGAAAGGAASIGSVLAKGNASQQQAGGAMQGGQGGQSGDQHQGDDPHGIDYRAAAIRGVGAGLAVIVLALMAYLLL